MFAHKQWGDSMDEPLIQSDESGGQGMGTLDVSNVIDPIHSYKAYRYALASQVPGFLSMEPMDYFGITTPLIAKHGLEGHTEALTAYMILWDHHGFAGIDESILGMTITLEDIERFLITDGRGPLVLLTECDIVVGTQSQIEHWLEAVRPQDDEVVVLELEHARNMIREGLVQAELAEGLENERLQ